MQADAYAGFGKLYEANRKGGPIIEAACWAHGRRKFFDLARLSKAPIAAEAVIATAKLNDIDPQAWFADVLARPAGSSRQAHSRTPALELAPSQRRSRRLSAINYPPKATRPGAVAGCVPRYGIIIRYSSNLMELGSFAERSDVGTGVQKVSNRHATGLKLLDSPPSRSVVGTRPNRRN